MMRVCSQLHQTSTAHTCYWKQARHCAVWSLPKALHTPQGANKRQESCQSKEEAQGAQTAVPGSTY